jgi:hypothetical protein
MPFKKKKVDKTRPASIAVSDGLWALFCDREIPADDDDTRALLCLDEAGVRKRWDACKDELLAQWRNTYPGTRPSHWWKWDAPRQSTLATPEPEPEEVEVPAETPEPLPEGRKFLSGAGCPAHMVLAFLPQYSMGLPVGWVGVDPADLPKFESQAAFLQRHGLLSSSEAARSNFAPEVVDYSDVWFRERDGPNKAGVQSLKEQDARIRQKIITARREHGMVTQ